MVPPQSVNITLNQRVLLNCTAVASFINWFVNGTTPVSDLNMAVFDESVKTGTSGSDLRTKLLSVLGTPESNESRITCVGTTHSPPSQESSDPALILVQGEEHELNRYPSIIMYIIIIYTGLLESVSNLTVTLINSTTVLISWSPPFTLEGVPILGYNVTITNTTSGENETMLLNSTGHSDPQTSLLYSIDHPDPEYNFIVTVVPISKFGAGQPAVISLIPGKSN